MLEIKKGKLGQIINSTDLYDYINGFLMNPSAFIIVIIVVIVYVIIFSSLGSSQIPIGDTNNMSDTTNSMNLIYVILAIMLVVLILINGYLATIPVLY